MKLSAPAKTILLVALFAVAMGYLESAVVVYIRALYYPEGFAFPMKVISNSIMVTEFWREAATIVMLLGVGILAGKSAITRFAYFLLAFAVWDIFYYVFLWVLIGWPLSPMTWDVLFFIPTTWVGPVLAPVVNSLTMIALALVIVFRADAKHRMRTGWLVWTLLGAGSLVILYAYTEEYSRFMLQRYSWGQLLSNGNQKELLEYATSYIPQHFKWWVFVVGEAMHLAAVGRLLAV